MVPKSPGYVVIYYIANILICLGLLDHSNLNMMGGPALYSLEPKLLSGDMTGMTLFSAIAQPFLPL